MNPLDEVIVAIATPIGEGGISVVRLSGEGAIAVADQRFQGRNRLVSVSTHTAHFGCFVDGKGDIIDEVVATVFRAPHSYTSQDIVEISCHGGILVTRKILESVLDSGARIAEPGEFTKRAFLNGRIDLSQAEAVADIISSRSEAAHKSSLSQLRGRLSGKITEMREQLLNICSLMELELDFAEEGIEFTDKSKISDELNVIIHQIEALIGSYKFGKVYREWVRVVLAGRPNVGKSSILNTLLNENRAIVTEIPGTTRDVIQESLTIGGLLFSVTDTAGIRDSADLIELEGVKRTHQEIERSQIVLFIIEPNKNNYADDLALMSRVPGKSRQRVILVVNKMDLCANENFELPHEFNSYPRACISAKTGYGLQSLEKLLVDSAVGSERSPDQSIVVTNARHVQDLQQAMLALANARNELDKGTSNEFVSTHLRAALDSLGEIIGIVTTDDVLNNIFSKFCIGK